MHFQIRLAAAQDWTAFASIVSGSTRCLLLPRGWLGATQVPLHKTGLKFRSEGNQPSRAELLTDQPPPYRSRGAFEGG
jgi:hypothetical protein